MSRRTWWAVTGGAVLTAASAAFVWKQRGPGAARASADTSPAGYVDHDGWMLTPADQEKLGQAVVPGEGR
jgi:hypothetical protein